jgi:hypothetical protein
MSVRSGRRVDTVFWVQLVLGAFLFTLGLKGLVYGDYGLFGSVRGIRGLFHRRDETLLVIIALVETAAGLLFLAGLFFAEGRALFWAALVLLALWLIQLIYFYLLEGAFEPNFVVWLNRLSFDLLPAVGMWMVARRYL